MSTKFYFRNTACVDAPTAGQKSGVTTVLADNGMEDRSLLLTPGSSQVEYGYHHATVTPALGDTGYYGRFTSFPLVGTTIPATVWQSFMAGIGNPGGNWGFRPFIWRPSTSAVVGFLYDRWAYFAFPQLEACLNSAERGRGGNSFLGSPQAVTFSDGDVLVVEVFIRKDVTGANAGCVRDLKWWFDGATDPTNGTDTSDAASYLVVPADLLEYPPAGGTPKIVMLP